MTDFEVLVQLVEIKRLLQELVEQGKPKVVTHTGVSGDPRPRPVGVLFNQAEEQNPDEAWRNGSWGDR